MQTDAKNALSRPTTHGCMFEQLYNRTMNERVLTVENLTENLVSLARALGLHRPDQTRDGEAISMTEAHALMDLTGGEMSQSQLATRLRLQKSTVSRLVEQLRKRGWIARHTARHDRRIMLVHLTTKGRAAMQQISRKRHVRFNQLLARIPRERQESVVETISTLVRGLEDSARKPSLRRATRHRIRAAGRFIPD